MRLERARHGRRCPTVMPLGLGSRRGGAECPGVGTRLPPPRRRDCHLVSGREMISKGAGNEVQKTRK